MPHSFAELSDDIVQPEIGISEQKAKGFQVSLGDRWLIKNNVGSSNW